MTREKRRHKHIKHKHGLVRSSTHARTHARAHTHTHTHAQVHIHTCTSPHTHMHTSTVWTPHTHMHTSTRAHTCTCPCLFPHLRPHVQHGLRHVQEGEDVLRRLAHLRHRLAEPRQLLHARQQRLGEAGGAQAGLHRAAEHGGEGGILSSRHDLDLGMRWGRGGEGGEGA